MALILMFFAAMQDALTKGSRVHRDISVGNIVLVREGDQAVRKGYLIDWEYSCKADEGGVACNEDRVVRLHSVLCGHAGLR